MGPGFSGDWGVLGCLLNRLQALQKHTAACGNASKHGHHDQETAREKHCLQKPFEEHHERLIGLLPRLRLSRGFSWRGGMRRAGRQVPAQRCDAQRGYTSAVVVVAGTIVVVAISRRPTSVAATERPTAAAAKSGGGPADSSTGLKPDE